MQRKQQCHQPVKEKKKAEPKKKKEMTLQEQRNKMSPMELFSQLPAELRGKIGDIAIPMSEKDRSEKPTMTNIFDKIVDNYDWYEALDNAVIGEFERMAYYNEFNFNTATDEQNDKMRERLETKMYRALSKETKSLLKEFLKGKKFKTATESADAFVKVHPLQYIEFNY